MSRQMWLSDEWCPGLGSQIPFLKRQLSKQGTNRHYSTSLLATVGRAVSAIPFEISPFQGLLNSAIKISSKWKLGMRSFSLRMNFFFFTNCQKRGRTSPMAIFAFFFFNCTEIENRNALYCLCTFWNSDRNIYRPLWGMNVLELLRAS